MPNACVRRQRSIGAPNASRRRDRRQRCAFNAGTVLRTQTWLCCLDRVAGRSGASDISSGRGRTRSVDARSVSRQCAEKSCRSAVRAPSTGYSSFKRHDRRLPLRSASARRPPRLATGRYAALPCSGSLKSHDDVCSRDYRRCSVAKIFCSCHCMRANDAAISASLPSTNSSSRCRFTVAAPNPT